MQFDGGSVHVFPRLAASDKDTALSFSSPLPFSSSIFQFVAESRVRSLSWTRFSGLRNGMMPSDRKVGAFDLLIFVSLDVIAVFTHK